MKFFIVLAALVAVAVAAPANSDAEALVVSQTNEVNPDGSFSNSLKTDNGISQEESGQLKESVNGETGEKGSAVAVQGSVSWTAPDGQQFSLRYIADENGYQPQGEHLPTPPPAQ